MKSRLQSLNRSMNSGISGNKQRKSLLKRKASVDQRPALNDVTNIMRTYDVDITQLYQSSQPRIEQEDYHIHPNKSKCKALEEARYHMAKIMKLLHNHCGDCKCYARQFDDLII